MQRWKKDDEKRMWSTSFLWVWLWNLQSGLCWSRWLFFVFHRNIDITKDITLQQNNTFIGLFIFSGPSNNDEETNNNVVDEDYQADPPYPYSGVEPYIEDDNEIDYTFNEGNQKI